VVQIHGLLYDGSGNTDGDDNLYLRLDPVLVDTEERLDSKMLFDPFEKQFLLSATPIRFGNRDGRQCNFVRQKHERFVVL